MGQIVAAFGVREFHRCLSTTEAERLLASKPIDLMIIEPALREGDGYELIKNLRRSGRVPACTIPIIIITLQAGNSDVARARDCGADFVVAKPITPKVLLQRIQWIARDQRPFVEAGEYAGPDRRFKFEGPPPGVAPRRATDVNTKLGEAKAPNMSQNEIDSLIKPQKVMLD